MDVDNEGVVKKVRDLKDLIRGLLGIIHYLTLNESMNK